jgi:iron complex transport system permease protein
MLLRGVTTSRIFAALTALSLILFLLSLRFGAISLNWEEIRNAASQMISGSTDATLNERIFREIRLPRAILCFLVGASLAVSGVLMQALFRNPIVEPGLIGTSSGAAFGAALYFVLGATFSLHLNQWTLPIAAAAGGTLSTGLVLHRSRSPGPLHHLLEPGHVIWRQLVVRDRTYTFVDGVPGVCLPPSRSA